MGEALIPARVADPFQVVAEAKPGGAGAPANQPKSTKQFMIPKAAAGLQLARSARSLSQDQVAEFRPPNPFPLRQIPSKVLEEEDYVEALDTIIERDYFPDLPRLRVEHKLLQAKADGKDNIVKKLRDQLATMTPATPVVPGTPGTPATPMPGGVVDLTDKRGGQQVKRLTDGKECIVDTNVRLDTFQARFTSEDNASFEQIVKKDKALRAEKEWYIEAQQLVHNAELADQQIAVNDGDSGRQIVLTNKFTARDFLNVTEFAPQSAGGFAQPSSAASCNYGNTRFPTKVQESEGAQEAAALARRGQLVQAQDDERDADSMAATGSFQRKGLSGGRFPLVGTPRMDPNDMTPIMTYGEVGATPLVLDDRDGPSFKIPEASKKEARAHALAEEAVKRARDLKRKERATTSKPWMVGKKSILSTQRSTPGTSRLGTPRSSIFNGRTPGSQTPRSTPGRSTPLVATPSSTPRETPPPGMTPTQAEPRSSANTHMPPPKRRREVSSLPADLTDGLL
jgi:protein DGCR14